MAAVPTPAMRVPVCLSVCPHLAARSSPAAGCVRQLPVKSVSLSSEELMAVLGKGKTRSAHPPTPRRCRRRARESRQGEQAGRAPAAAHQREPTQA